jgi:hypothetical protein
VRRVAFVLAGHVGKATSLPTSHRWITLSVGTSGVVSHTLRGVVNGDTGASVSTTNPASSESKLHHATSRLIEGSGREEDLLAEVPLGEHREGPSTQLRGVTDEVALDLRLRAHLVGGVVRRGLEPAVAGAMHPLHVVTFTRFVKLADAGVNAEGKVLAVEHALLLLLRERGEHLDGRQRRHRMHKVEEPLALGVVEDRAREHVHAFTHLTDALVDGEHHVTRLLECVGGATAVADGDLVDVLREREAERVLADHANPREDQVRRRRAVVTCRRHAEDLGLVAGQRLDLLLQPHAEEDPLAVVQDAARLPRRLATLDEDVEELAEIVVVNNGVLVGGETQDLAVSVTEEGLCADDGPTVGLCLNAIGDDAPVGPRRLLDVTQRHRGVSVLTDALAELVPGRGAGEGEAVDLDAVFNDSFDSVGHDVPLRSDVGFRVKRPCAECLGSLVPLL